MDIRTIIKIDDLIQRSSTGSPVELSERLEMSERTVYKYLKFMKEELEAPIAFSKARVSYVYKDEGGFIFKWKIKN